ncbi:MAG: ADP-ribosyltransferase, partial [Dermatophilaceae bacterium]
NTTLTTRLDGLASTGDTLRDRLDTLRPATTNAPPRPPQPNDHLMRRAPNTPETATPSRPGGREVPDLTSRGPGAPGHTTPDVNPTSPGTSQPPTHDQHGRVQRHDPGEARARPDSDGYSRPPSDNSDAPDHHTPTTQSDSEHAAPSTHTTDPAPDTPPHSDDAENPNGVTDDAPSSDEAPSDDVDGGASHSSNGTDPSARDLFGEGSGDPDDPRTFPYDPDAIKYGSAEWNEYVEQLPEDQKRALNDYTKELGPGAEGLTYKEINGALRGLRPTTPELRGHIDLIDQALAGHPVPEDIMVTRGTGIGHYEAHPRFMAGKTVDEKAYMSTSLGGPADAFAAEDAVLHLQVPKGTPALWMEKISAFGNSERELLLGRGLSYRVDRVAFEKDQWHIYGKVLGRAEVVSR